jgi:hypothetical protein
MTLAEPASRRRRDAWRRLGVSVDGAKLWEAILGDLEQLDPAGADVGRDRREADA